MHIKPKVLRSLSASVALALLAAAPARGQNNAPFTVTLSPATTAVHWTLNSTLHIVHGTFKLESGEIRIDPATGDAAGLIVIDAASGESGDSARDRRMHGSIIESGSFPQITYRPTHVSGHIDLTAGSDFTVDGTFHLHGSDHPLQMAIHLAPGAKLSTHFAVPFVAWGLKEPSTFVFRTDKKVAIDIDAAYVATPEHSPAKAILKPGEVHTAQ